jgi:hypothetical protein
MGASEQLQALHDTYVWEVNAAIGEGRLDLVWQLADAYLDEAVAFMVADVPPGCGDLDCAVCRRPRPSVQVRRRRSWGRRHRGGLVG